MTTGNPIEDALKSGELTFGGPETETKPYILIELKQSDDDTEEVSLGINTYGLGHESTIWVLEQTLEKLKASTPA